MIVPVIMAGGAGTRLWPASSETMPKQFIALFGARSSFQETLARLANDPLFAPPIVLTHSDFRFIAAEQARAVGVNAEIILEPERRDSAPAVAVAAILAGARSADAVTLVLAADLIMPDGAAFTAACREACKTAEAGMIVTFGITPSGPATSYGYLKPGRELPHGDAKALVRFAEKPDLATAERYIREGYLWNSGNFLFRADVMAAEIERLEPRIWEAAEASLASASRDADFLRLVAEPFRAAPRISIDYAVMEKTDKAAVLPVSFVWSDIGSWEAYWRHCDKDADGNAIHGPVHVRDATNVLVRSEPGIVTAVVGVNNVCVVATDSAVLVVSRAKAEQVKSVVETLNEAGQGAPT